MKVLAGADGILQELPLEVGQWAQSGATLARLVEPGKLKAVLRIPETQAKDVAIGQPAAIDTRNGIVEGQGAPDRSRGPERHRDRGRVARGRAAPRRAAGPLGGRHDRGRAAARTCCTSAGPRTGRPTARSGLFKLTPDGAEATRVNVRLGRTSVNTVEIARRPPAGRQGHHLRHVAVGRARPGEGGLSRELCAYVLGARSTTHGRDHSQDRFDS